MPAAQELVVLHIKVTVVDAEHRARPVPRHALLISDNPTSAAPRRTVTSPEGTADVRLRPGNYTVESDEPLVYQGKAYTWRQTIDVVAGREKSLELTAENADVESTAATSTMRPGEFTPSELLMQWQDSVVSIWSPTARGAGFLVDPKGLIVTNQRLVGAATSVEVQFALTKKVTARVLAADRNRNVAVLWIDPAVAAALKPSRLGYADPAKPVTEGQEIFAIDPIVLDQKSLESGNVTSVDAKVIASDLRVDKWSEGAPVLSAIGDVIGFTVPDEAKSKPGASDGRSHAVRIDEARTMIADAEKAIKSGTPPPAALLPVEPERRFPEAALKELIPRRAGSVAAYPVSATDFDVALMTPVQLYAAHHRPERTTGATKAGGRQDVGPPENAQRALDDFGSWSDYVADLPSALIIRATPKMVEGFWTSVGRAAASTQGVQLPAFKHLKTSFVRMRLYCGDAEVAPIHPFTIERRMDDNNVAYEGLYVFDPGAIGPDCDKVRLVLFSEKEPDKGDTRVIDAKVLEQIWKDFAPYRSATGQ